MVLEYKSTAQGGVLLFSGELDHHTAGHAIKAMNQILDDQRPGTLILDLKDLSFMDSSGLALFMSAHRRQRQIDGLMKIINVNTQPYRVICSAGLDRIINTEGSGVKR